MSLAGAATSIIFVATEVRLPRQTFCCDEIMFVATKLLMQQIFVLTNMCLSRQAYFCCDKGRVFFATNACLSQMFCHNKNTSVTTKPLSQQAYFCCDKGRVFLRQTRVCHKCSVTTKIHLSQQNLCHKKHTFVGTKMILWQLQPMIRKSPQNKIQNSS